MVVYARISDDREGRQNGVDRQERQCRALAAKNGDDITAVFVDDDRSAYSGKPRPDYLKMLAYLEAGHADGAYALAPTRFYRRLDDGLAFFKLITERRLEVQTVKQGRYDLSTADGRRDALRAAVDAQHEAEQISERVRDAKADNVAKGEYRGGPRPFGYRADGVTPDSLLCPGCGSVEGFTIERVCDSCGTEAVNAPGSEAWLTAEATDDLLAGASLRSIRADWAQKGIRTVPRRRKQPDGTRGEPESHEFGETEIRRLILRPRNAGLIEHRGEVVGRAQWAPIVAEDRWRAAVALLTNPARRTTTSNARVWLGSGLYRCHCGETLRGSSAGVGGTVKAKESERTSKPVYRCRTNASGHVVRDAIDLDEYVGGLAIFRLSRPDAAQLLLPREEKPSEDFAAQANALRAKLDGISADYAADHITRKQMLDQTAFVRARLEKVEEQMSAASHRSVLASVPLGTPEVEDQWHGYHLDRKRAIIAALMTVTVQKARRGRPKGYRPGTGQGYFDDSTIDIDWKQPG